MNNNKWVLWMIEIIFVLVYLLGFSYFVGNEHKEMYKNILNDLDNHNCVVFQLESDILECKVKWTLGNITTNKASEGDGIPAELFQILKDNSALNMPANLENSAVATGLEKVSFHSNPKERQYQRMFNYHTIALISHASKMMLKILQARLQ